MIVNLSSTNSLVGEWLSEIRSMEIQTDRMRFRRNLERVGEVAAFEISKTLEYEEKEVQTPLGIANCRVLKQQPVLATILRAGLAMHQGLVHYFDKADHAFISAYRKHNHDGSFDINLEYVSSPVIEDQVVIISDPMLATGASLVKTIEHLQSIGKPKHIHLVVAIACTVGIEYVQRYADNNLTIWAGDIDDELTAKGYIVPGLGDAGDLAFGNKLQN
ncbi:uracil phosphoribosyltransferase [Chitinophaga sancti]|uniref:Uracil phosphoribosyltransferase n=1 Tax=Chitinophaga sancti TaxID=1004 RepID=A0A1K1S9Q6_9BACT|nr:uracil phosphoribosyltransferase [Chitinophaga sancti]WQD60900.1 uracil phosphoribosyltransferase [Chitinophaga sancti]WQG86972.1 uracil phosphoribosyltransferase [Chitinophaga sancti]SFW81091.1 uracil phosphoribosyltransferase [Chitinophaga sancti]